MTRFFSHFVFVRFFSTNPYQTTFITEFNFLYLLKAKGAKAESRSGELSDLEKEHHRNVHIFQK